MEESSMTNYFYTTTTPTIMLLSYPIFILPYLWCFSFRVV